jgi:hypothetical protein
MARIAVSLQLSAVSLARQRRETEKSKRGKREIRV